MTSTPSARWGRSVAPCAAGSSRAGCAPSVSGVGGGRPATGAGAPAAAAHLCPPELQKRSVDCGVDRLVEVGVRVEHDQRQLVTIRKQLHPLSLQLLLVELLGLVRGKLRAHGVPPPPFLRSEPEAAWKQARG